MLCTARLGCLPAPCMRWNHWNCESMREEAVAKNQNGGAAVSGTIGLFPVTCQLARIYAHHLCAYPEYSQDRYV